MQPKSYLRLAICVLGVSIFFSFTRQALLLLVRRGATQLRISVGDTSLGKFDEGA